MVAGLNEVVTFACEGMPGGVVNVVAFRAREDLSTPFEMEVELVRGDNETEISPEGLLKKSAEVAITFEGNVERRFRGIVFAVREHASGYDKEYGVRVSLRSPMALLGLSTDYRIFQDKTTPQIVKSVLDACGVPADAYRFALVGTYKPREVCTQYGETMLAFVSRLLEEEGIFYYVDETPSKQVVVFGDDATAYAKVGPVSSFRYLKWAQDGRTRIDHVWDARRIRPSKVTLRDVDWTQPSLDLEAKATTAGPDAPGGREVYDYPGLYKDPGAGKARAKVRMEALVADGAGFGGTSTVVGLSAGHELSLSGSLIADGDLVVTRVEHVFARGKGTAAEYSNTFHAIPKAVPFRPLQTTPRPVVRGPQTAVVTGPKGEEIYVDKHGRIKVQFAWDRHGKFDDKSSFWVKVAQINLTGSMVTPRIGWEVLVEFEDGNPDRPVVVGRLYNGAYPPPYALPANKTRSSLMSFSSPGGEGHNEIRIEDLAGTEHVHWHAQKDMRFNTVRNREELTTTSKMTKVKLDQDIDVGKNQTIAIGAMSQATVGRSQSLRVEQSRSKTVEVDEKLSIFGERSLQIARGHTITVGDSDSTSTGKNLSTTIGRSLSEELGGVVNIQIGNDARYAVGGAKTERVVSGRTERIMGTRSETVGTVSTTSTQKDMATNVEGDRKTTVGGALTKTTGGDSIISSDGLVKIQVGGVLNVTGAGGITLKVGSSTVTIAAGSVVIDSIRVKITAMGPNAMLGALTSDN